MLLYTTSLIFIIVVAQSLAFHLPNAAISSCRTNQPSSLMVVTEPSLEVSDYDLDAHATLERERTTAPSCSIQVTVDNLDTSSIATVVDREKNMYEIYKVTDNETNDHFEKWILKLFNDTENTRSRVSSCLTRDVGLSEEESYTRMMHAHEHGEAIIGEYCQEHAEYYKEVLVGSGLVCDIFPVEKE